MENWPNVLGEAMFYQYHGDWKQTKHRRICEGLTSGRGYVALADGQVAGFIFYIVDEGTKTGIVEENAVASQFRGLGIAQRLYDYVFAKMREEGMVYAMVSTGLDEAHAPARRAYEKAGFGKGIGNIRYYKEL
jgi:GNAT superfamily N-acetyltransferase